MTTTAAPPLTCEARTGFFPGEWSELPLWCNATVGLRSWVDANGRTHRACRHHVVALMGRYPMPQAVDYERRYERTGADPAGMYAPTPCTKAGHVDGCAGKAGGEHELLPGWIAYEVDGDLVEVEVL